MLKENIDGEALLWAHERLMKRAEKRRILVVVSDGTPMDEATAAANGFEYLDDHLHQVVRAIETNSPVQLAAIGIGHDVSRVYRNATKIAKIDQLGPALTAKQAIADIIIAMERLAIKIDITAGTQGRKPKKSSKRRPSARALGRPHLQPEAEKSCSAAKLKLR